MSSRRDRGGLLSAVAFDNIRERWLPAAQGRDEKRESVFCCRSSRRMEGTSIDDTLKHRIRLAETLGTELKFTVPYIETTDA